MCPARRRTWAIGRAPTFISRLGRPWSTTFARLMMRPTAFRFAPWATTTEGRPYVVAVVSSPDTIKDLPKYQKLQRQLSHPGPHDDDDGGDLDPVPESKPVVVITCSIHSTETASTLMAMELLHELASERRPRDA